MYEQYLRDPASVSDDWRQLFDNGRLAELPVIPTDRAEVLGRREKGDVPSAAQSGTSPISPLPAGLTPLTGPAARLAQNMTDSLSVPTATSFRDVPVDTLDARRRELNARLASGGKTITLTNPGTIGTVASVPRLMKGQGSIIATGAIRQIGATRVMTLTSTYDHRVIQGAESGMFLRKLDAVLQGEERFYEVVAETLAITGLGARGSGVGETTARALPGPEPLTPSPDLKHVAAAMALVKAFRNFGHMAARLDPLGSDPPGDPALDPGPLGLTPEIMARVPAELLRLYVSR